VFNSVQDLVHLFCIDVTNMGNARNAAGFHGERGDVGAIDVLQPELARAGHQLPQALRQPLVVGIDADGAGRQLVETVTQLLA